MKALLRTSFIYLIAGLCGGVTFREITKFTGYTGRTALGFLHVHLVGLGAFVFLLLALFHSKFDIVADKSFRKFMFTYNGSLILMVVMFFIRGLMEVFRSQVSTMVNATVSGIAGLAHIGMTVGFVFLYGILRRGAAEVTVQNS